VAVFAAQVEARKLRIQAAIDRAAANHAADLAQNAAFQQALIDLNKSGFDRARANAETVQRAAGAIGTIYTGVLAVAFSVSSHPLPARGLLPALFLGLAVALSTAYLAYLVRNPPRAPAAAEAGVDPRGLAGQILRVSALSEAVKRAVHRRGYLMRAAVLALAIGVVTLPVGFVTVPAFSSPALAHGPDWPAVPTASANADLAKVRYEAEVAEVARLRQSPAAAGAGDLLVLLGFGIAGTIVVFAGAAVGGRTATTPRPQAHRGQTSAAPDTGS
jgi:hypothetical protein